MKRGRDIISYDSFLNKRLKTNLSFSHIMVLLQGGKLNPFHHRHNSLSTDTVSLCRIGCNLVS